MRYREVLSQAYTLTIRNPLLWLFGLVMLGGFNLSLINFFSIFQGNQWKQWPVLIDGLFIDPVAGWTVVALGIVVSFIILNFVKIVFVVVVHNLIHDNSKNEDDRKDKCILCLKKNQHLPYLIWLLRVVAASAITIGFTTTIAVLANRFISLGAYDGPAVIMINLIFVACVAAVFGIWNAFVNYYVIFYDFSFPKAARAAIDLMVLRAKSVFEFVIILSVIHTISVVVTNAFITAWPNDSYIYYGSQTATIFWFALNNAFFNVAFIVFYNSLVKSSSLEEKVGRLLPENRLN